MRQFLTLLILFSLSSWSLATESKRTIQISWIQDLKGLLQEIEAKENSLLVTEEREFLERFFLINHAYADSRYDCFFGGWPSKSVLSGGRKLCTNPSKGNETYSQGKCAQNEMQCNPVLFGKNICVPFGSKSEKNATFSNCEKKFSKNYSFLDQLSRNDVEELKEISRLASEGCLKSQTSICEKIIKRLPTGLRSLDELEKELAEKERYISMKAVSPPKEKCEEVSSLEKIDRELKKNSYAWIKEKFLKSPLCDPLKIINDDTKEAPAAIVSALNRNLKIFDQRHFKMDFFIPEIERISKKYELPETPELKKHLNEVVNSKNEDERRLHMARFKVLFNQLLLDKKDFSQLKDIASENLMGANIFEEDEEGTPTCPFLSEDAFNKAIKGFESVKGKHGGKISKKNQLTIVDYTKPSNSRRLFVIDLESGEVLQNTWVAHGSGGGTTGSDGIGGGPEVSNRSGSLMSSDGFILATKASSGSLYGPNVLLQGLDKNNGNLASRAVVVHGWGSPMGEFNQGVSDYNGEGYGPRFDIVEKVKSLDLKENSYREMEKRLFQLQGATSTMPYLPATEGCLGVPLNNTSHLDPKKRNKSQLEILREDLPGSVIFSYSGEEMNSSYF